MTALCHCHLKPIKIEEVVIPSVPSVQLCVSGEQWFCVCVVLLKSQYAQTPLCPCRQRLLCACLWKKTNDCSVRAPVCQCVGA